MDCLCATDVNVRALDKSSDEVLPEKETHYPEERKQMQGQMKGRIGQTTANFLSLLRARVRSM